MLAEKAVEDEGSLLTTERNRPYTNVITSHIFPIDVIKD